MKTLTGYLVALAISVVGLLVILLVVSTSSSGAQADLTLTAPQDVRRGSGIVTVDEVAVPAELQGKLCDASLTATNNPSIHPGNDLILTSTTSTEFSEIEAEPDGIDDDSGTLVLGASVRLDLRFGPNGVSSAGWVVTIDCPPDATTTTSSVPSSSTTTEPPGTTTTTLPDTPPETSIPVTVPDYTG